MQTLTDDQIYNALRDFGRRLLYEQPHPGLFNTGGQSNDRDFVEFYNREQIVDLELAIQDEDYEAHDGDRLEDAANMISAMARRFAGESGISVDALDPGRRIMVQEGLARAMIEEQLQFLHRSRDRLTPYAPSHPLFASAAPSNVEQSQPDVLSPSFAAAVEGYIARKSGVAWSARTEQEAQRILGLAGEHFGPETPIGAITKAQVRAFRDDLVKWRKRPASGAGLSEIQNAPEAEQIGAKTAAKYFNYLTSAFNDWVNEGHMTNSPASGLKVQVPKGKKIDAREPFSDDDLRFLFSSPMYTGCAGPLRRTMPGPHRIQDGYYWIPLIAALSGMRVSEIVQLGLSDVDIGAGVPVFRVNGAGGAGKTLKTDASWREVPVHRRLLQLGFGMFVEDRQIENAGARLFHDVTLARTGGGGGEYSKWFGRLMRKLDLHRPKLVFHSFRHRFADELRALGAPNYVIKRLVGHEGGDVTDDYGSHVSAAALQPWVDKIELLDHLPPDI